MEYYLCDKLDELKETNIDTILRMNRHNTMARIMNAIHSHIEKETEKLKDELMAQVINILEREL